MRKIMSMTLARLYRCWGRASRPEFQLADPVALNDASVRLVELADSAERFRAEAGGADSCPARSPTGPSSAPAARRATMKQPPATAHRVTRA